MKVYIDSETCGLHGYAVILQYAFEKCETPNDATIHNFWKRPVSESLELIERIADCDVVAFNLAFDWFHLCKWYTTLLLLDPDSVPEEQIDLIAKLEERARDGKCLKPRRSLDLMLHARKTEFQMTMERSDIRIRRVPTKLAWVLAKELEERVVFSELLFARNKRSKLAPRWVVHDIRDKVTDEIDKDFKDIVLKFKPSMALKMLALYALNIPRDEIISFADIDISSYWLPAELGYAPYCQALYRLPRKQYAKLFGKKSRQKRPWPEVIREHIAHWEYRSDAREYARKDVWLLYLLDKKFDFPEPGDDDSELAASVAACRWRGYSIDIPALEQLRADAVKKRRETPISSKKVKHWLGEVMSETERKMFTSTKKVVLERLAMGVLGEECPFGKCSACNNTGRLPPSEVAIRAKTVLEARMAGKEIELFDKLLLAGRFHASFKVTGALSNRMSGADGLNPQGVKRTKSVREVFKLVHGKLPILSGGDFAAFEVVLAIAVYGDKKLEQLVLTCEKCRDVQVVFNAGKKSCPKCGGKKTLKIHALFGMQVFPGMTYDEIMASEGTAQDRYTPSKSGLFALIYGGMAFTLMTRLGVSQEAAEAAYDRFMSEFPDVAKSRQRVIDSFCSLRQEGGIGSKIIYREPAQYVESLLGFKRYFTLENEIVKCLFELAQNPPPAWRTLKIKVRRRDRDQTASGAVQSALYGTAFQIQAANMRAAANHEIQSTGAGITKRVQRRIWDLQPPGGNDWLVQPMNVHDQVLCPSTPEIAEEVAKVVYETVESFRKTVPLIELDWKRAESWGDK